jgi:hypothetical protein
LPKTSNESNKKANGLRFVEEERKTVLAIFDLLLNGDDDDRKAQCVGAMEELFALTYKRLLTGDDGIDIHPVLREAAQKFEVTPEDITGPKRSPEVKKARLWVARKLRRNGMSYPKIGKILNRNHSTVMSILGAR